MKSYVTPMLSFESFELTMKRSQAALRSRGSLASR